MISHCPHLPYSFSIVFTAPAYLSDDLMESVLSDATTLVDSPPHNLPTETVADANIGRLADPTEMVDDAILVDSPPPTETVTLVDSLPPTETVADAILVDTPPKNPPTKTADSLFPNKIVHPATVVDSPPHNQMVNVTEPLNNPKYRVSI